LGDEAGGNYRTDLLPNVILVRKGGYYSVDKNEIGILIPILALDDAKVQTKAKEVGQHEEWVIGSTCLLTGSTVVVEVREGMVAFLNLVFRLFLKEDAHSPSSTEAVGQ
jgi:hypothetical protein